MTHTIAGPLRGVIATRPPRLEVRRVNTQIDNIWRVVWVQSIKEEAGWDELVVGTSDKTGYASEIAATAAMINLRDAGERSPE